MPYLPRILPVLMLSLLAHILSYQTLAQEPVHNFSNDFIQLAWFTKPPADGNLQLLAKHFDTYVLTHRDEAARDALKSQGVTSPFLQYYISNQIHNPGPDSCTAQPWGNNVTDQPGDFCWIRDNHPDWFLRDVEGNIAQETWSSRHNHVTFAFMDPANRGWQEYFVSRVLERQERYGWEGLFLDNIDASLARFERIDIELADYPDNASYQAAVASFLQYVDQHYAQASGRPVFANITALKDSKTWFTYLQFLDGAMEEGWGVDWHDGYLNPASWEKVLSRIEQTQTLGKYAILVAEADHPYNTARQQFAFASYLLIANKKAAFRYASPGAYNEAWLYPNYDCDLGDPLGSRYLRESNMWQRDFTKGYVIVNPVTHEAQINCTPPSIANLTLINADSDEDIGLLSDGAVIDLANLPTQNLNIRANTAERTASVQFGLNDNPNYQIENGLPYAIAGDNSGDYNAWTPEIGMYRLTVTPYNAPDADGTAGETLIVNFEIVNSITAQTSQPHILYFPLIISTSPTNPTGQNEITIQNP